MSDVAGCTVEEFDTFSFLGAPVTATDAGASLYELEHLAELLEPASDAKVLLTYRGRYYSGRAAATRHRFGAGTCYYLGSYPTEQGLRSFLPPVLRQAGVGCREDLPFSVETTCRSNGAARLRFYLNHGTNAVTCPAFGPRRDLLGGVRIEGTISLEPRAVAVMKEA